MHGLSEFRCKHLFRFLWKFSVFWCQLDNCFHGTLGNIWLPVAIDIIISRGVAFLVWVKKTCWTKYLHRDFKLVRKVCVYLRNILNNFADWKRKCIPASILIVYWKHWDCLMRSSNLWQQMSTHHVWWTSLSNTNTFFFVLASLNSRPSLRHAQIQIFILLPLFGVIQRHCISCLSFTIPFANKVIKTHRCLETSQ